MSEAGGNFSQHQAPMIVMLFFVVAVQLLAVALMPTLLAGEVRVFEDPESAVNPFSYIFLVLAFTAFLLMAMKLRWGWVVSGFIHLAVAISIYYVLSALIPALLAVVLSIVVALVLRLYPEWYVVDLVGLAVCAGVSTLFGISMTVIPALLMLAGLAVYDAISVYKTRHMVALAESAIKIRAPLLFVVPRRRNYSFRRNGAEGRGAYFLGLGDAIIPTILVVSANWSLPGQVYGWVNLPSLGAMLGTYLGFVALMMTSREKPQAGLPFLNGGAILGFLIGYAIWTVL